MIGKSQGIVDIPNDGDNVRDTCVDQQELLKCPISSFFPFHVPLNPRNQGIPVRRKIGGLHTKRVHCRLEADLYPFLHKIRK